MKDDIFSRIENEDQKLKEFAELYEKLSKFLTDFDFLKAKNNLTQEDIAKKAETTQSSISRIETFKTNPSYKILQKLATAVGGELYLTPMADMTITVPYDLQDSVRELADIKDKSTQDFLLDILRKEIKSQYTMISSMIMNLESLDSGYFNEIEENDDSIIAA